MNGNVKYLVFGVCVALLVLGAFVGAASATTWYVDEEGGTDLRGIPRAIDIATGGGWAVVYGWSYAEKTTATSPSIAMEAIEKDTTQGSVSIDSETIDVNIKLLNTPFTLVFNQDFTTQEEYIKFQGTAVTKESDIYGMWWVVTLTKLISGPQPSEDTINVALLCFVWATWAPILLTEASVQKNYPG